MSNIVIDIAAEFTGKNAFKSAENSTEKLTRSVKKLAKNLGIAYGTQQILAYGKASVKAAAADQKAQQQLALALKNVGLGRDATNTEAFIQQLQSEFGVIDDQLRPAYQRLAVATRNSAESQKLLQLSLDISASTGKDLESVTSALSKAYLGNNTALSKLGVGISKADLKAGNFNDIVDKLSTTFAGSAKQAANSYSGTLDKLNVASNNVKETIGIGIIDALKLLGQDQSIDTVTKKMEGFAKATNETLVGLSSILSKIQGNKLGGAILGTFSDIITNLQPLALFRKEGQKVNATKNRNGDNASALADLARLESLYKTKTLDSTKKITTLTSQQLKDARAKAILDKANAALNKGTDLFNMDAIQIQAALINQAEQLGKATTSSQILQIANDTARLKIKQDILDLEAAIVAGDEASITAATNKLNADMKILSSLQQQNLKLIDIRDLLKSLEPKDLINLANLEAALALLGQINLASTGSKTTPASTVGVAGGSNTAGNQYSNQVGNGMYGMQVASSIDATNLNTALLGGVVSVIGSNLKEYLTPNPAGFGSGAYDVNITVNTGVGDPNAIADAINQVIQDAVDRGTLRGGSY
jgi:hypothetical protein